MYVCERCGWGIYHPTSYCMRCPGKLIKREGIEHIRFPTNYDTKAIQKCEEAQRQKLAEQGITYNGEGSQFTKLEIEQNILNRYKERAASVEQEINEAARSNDDQLMKKLERCLKIWTDGISQQTKIISDLTNG